MARLTLARKIAAITLVGFLPLVNAQLFLRIHLD
jgi:hypothetical protein